MILTLDEQQQAAVDQMAAEPTRAALLAAETGVGKTVMTAELVKKIGAKTVLVIAPLNTKGSIKRQDGWHYTFHRQGIDLPFYEIKTGSEENYDRLKNNEPGVYFVGREFFGLSATSLKPKKRKDGTWTRGRNKRWSWGKVYPDLAVFDEVQAASNRNSTTYQVLKTLKAGYKVGSSATPQGNQFPGLWSVCRWLWGDTHRPDMPYDADAPYLSLYVDNSFWRWAATWAKVEDNPHGGAHSKKVVGEQKPGAFVASLPCYIRIEAERTEVETRKVYVDLTPRQREIYDQMEDSMLAWLDSHPLIADVPIVQRARLRQITLGEPTVVDTCKVDPETEMPMYEVTFEPECESSKINALEKIITKYHPSDPMVIYTDSQRFARVVAHRLGPLAQEWSGKTSKKERERIKSEFGATVRYIVAVIPAMAEGVDGLQKVCSTEVWLSESVNGMLNEQAEGRLNRRGQVADKIIQWKILARRTDDDGTFNKLVQQRRANRATLAKGA